MSFFRKPAKMLVLPLSTPINDGKSDPRLIVKTTLTDNTMTPIDETAYASPAWKRMGYPHPILCRRRCDRDPAFVIRQAS